MSWLFALRQGRWGIAGFSALAFALTLLQALAFYQVAGHTQAERAAFAKSMALLAAQFSVLVPTATRLDTVGGYVQWRAYGFFAIVFAIWAVASAVGASRGDEERGLVEAVLAAGVSRADALAARFIAFVVGSLAAASAGGLGVAAGVAGAHDSISAASLVGVTVLLAGLALACYGLALLVSQLTAARMAAAASGAVILALFLVNSFSRSFDWLRPWRWISPFYYYDLSQPLAPGGTLDVRATEILFGIAVVAGLAAALAFSRRDIGAPLFRLPTIARPSSYDLATSSLWRIPVVRGLYDRRVGLVTWMVGVGTLAVVMTVLTKEVVKPLLAIANLGPYFNSILKGDIYPSFLGFIWFGFAPLLVAAFAITQVARWSAEDVDGRLELALANPVSRLSVVVERGLVLLLGALLIAGVSGLAVGVESHLQAIDVSSSRLAAASLLLVPFATFFAAIGSILAARIPRATVPLLAGFAIASYFVTQVGPLFKWPALVEDLSPFHLYGQPLTGGVDTTGVAIMVGATLVGFGASAFVMQRRDIGA